MSKQTNIYSNIDWLLILLYFVLVTFGWMNILAVSYNDQFKSVFDISQNYGIQLVWIIVSFFVIFIIFIIDDKFFHFFAYLIYGITIIPLIAVLLFGQEINTSQSWIKIAGLSIQPSEFAKIGVSIAIARFLSGFAIKKITIKVVLVCCALVFVPLMLVLLQPDWGTALVFMFFLVVLYREGLPGWILGLFIFLILLFFFSLILQLHIILIALLLCSLVTQFIINKNSKISLWGLLIFIGSGLLIFITDYYFNLTWGIGMKTLFSLILSTIVFLVLALSLKLKNITVILAFLCFFIAIPYSVDFVFHNILKSHQRTRIEIMLGKIDDPKGSGYNLNQSKIAIGSGGFAGKGFLNGTQTKLDFVPEQSTDFIFCTVGEEWGFLGSTMILILFTGLLIRILIIAERQRLKFARVYGYCVASILFIHYTINVSMTLGLFPIVGIPLPFFSKGGSSLLGFTILLFILLKMDSVRMKYLKK